MGGMNHALAVATKFHADLDDDGCGGCHALRLENHGLAEELRRAEADHQVPDTLAHAAADLTGAVVDALQPLIGRDIRDAAPTVLGPLVIDAGGREWIARWVPAAGAETTTNENREDDAA